MSKKLVLRRCVVTREQLEKKDLLRVVKNKEGLVFVDQTLKANGRGAYLKKSLEVIELAKKRNSIGRALETSIDESIYEQLKELIWTSY